jgi:hypothetical protein
VNENAVTTMIPARSPTSDFLRLTAAALVTAAVLIAAGWVPTQRIAGSAALASLLAGVGTSLLASLAGAVPIALSRSRTPAARQTAMMGAMALRMAITLALFAALALTNAVPRAPLGLWTGVSYVCLLAVETGMAVWMVGRREG